MRWDAWLFGRRGQAFAAAIAVAVAVVAWLGIVMPAWFWFQDRTALLEQRQALLLHMRSVAAALPRWRDAAATPSAGSDAATSVFMTGASDAVAAADLQERLQGAASSAGVSITAVETQPAEDIPAGFAGPRGSTDRISGAGKAWHRVGLRITLKGPWPAVVGFLQSVQHLPMRLFVDDVHLHHDGVAAQPASSSVQASMLVYGVWAPLGWPGT
ncbi:MAG TPA: type II secretion system protein GspM [Rhodopila sp.]|nr:type II secretion system protein GspM [Rhodopila sp.]